MTEQALALAGSRKVAALMIALGTDVAARLLAKLSPEDVDQVALDLVRTPRLDATVRDALLEEAHASLIARAGALAGGEQFTNDVFARAFGASKAKEVLGRVAAAQRIVPFEFLQALDPAEAAELLSGEHPQTIALVLAHLDPRAAAAILTKFEATLQAEVARRIAQTEQANPDALAVVEEGLRRRMVAEVSRAMVVGGARPLAHVLNQVDRTTERQILSGLDEQDPDLADEVRRFMFVFEDIVSLDDRSIQRVIRELDQKDIALALRSADESVREAFFRNMSSRAAEMVREEMSLTRQVRLKNVEEAQGRIVQVIKRLGDQDEIIINRGGSDDSLV